MDDNIKVSVIIPVYNVENYLAKCLDSIINQTETAIEIICIEDCSTDSSGQILERYSNKYDRIRIMRNAQNKGQAYSRNRGIEIARGEYLFFVDADDYIPLNIISDLYDESIKKELDMLLCDVEMVNESYISCQLQPRMRKYDYQINAGISLCAKLAMNGEMFGAPWGILYKTSCIKDNQIRFRAGVIHEDIPFVFNAIINSKRVGCKNILGYYYVQRSNSTMHDDNVEKRLSGMLIAYFDMLTMCNSWECIEEEDMKGIKKFLNTYLDLIKGYFSQIKGSQQTCKNWMLAYVDEMKLFEMAEHTVEFTTEDWTRIQESKYVAIYGAKKNAIKVLRALNQRNVHVDCFVVSDLRDNRVNVENIKVISWDELNMAPQDVVIVSGIAKRKLCDIEDKVRSKGYSLIQSLDI